MAKFKIYLDAAGKYRWRLVASNGEKIASSGESFSSRDAARDAAQRVKTYAGSAPIENE